MFYILEHVYRCRRFCRRCHNCYACCHCHFDYNVQLFLLFTSLCNYVHHIAVLVLVLIVFIPSHPYCMHPHRTATIIKLRGPSLSKRKDNKNDKNRLFQHRSLELQDMVPTKDLHSIKPTLIMPYEKAGPRNAETGDLFFKLECLGSDVDSFVSAAIHISESANTTK